METTEFVSLIALVQTPEMYDGADISVVGLCSFLGETHAMWVAVEHYNQGHSRNAVWLELPPEMDMAQFHGQVMLIDGTFSAAKRGPGDRFGGAIEGIGRMKVWNG